MTLFEPYLEKADREQRPPLDCSIRPALVADAPALGEIAAEREGGSPDEHAATLRRVIAALGATGEGVVLVAQHEGGTVGFGKARFFSPAEDAPDNVAPRGWYLSGLIVATAHRRRGLGKRLIAARLAWIAERDAWAHYFANARNRVTIELHEPFGFTELTRDFSYPGASFEGGAGILFRARLDGP